MFKKTIFTVLLATLTIFCLIPLLSLTDSAEAGAKPSLETILDGIEKRYGGEGFKADFYQESTLKAMDITDTASGNVVVKRPGKMRWEYVEPEKQTIITNGRDLWVFHPEDNQVMVGKSPYFFGDGKGAGFLSDIKMLRNHFKITLEKSMDAELFRLKLVPLKETVDMAKIYLQISKKTYDALFIITINAYGDETKIRMTNYRFNVPIDDDLFKVKIPKGADIINLE